MRVVVERVGEGGVAGLAGPLAYGPAVVATRCAHVHLLVGIQAHVVDEELAGGEVEGHGERVAQAQRPDRRRVEGVADGHAAVLVDAQHLAQQTVHILRISVHGVVAGRYVQESVWAELDWSSVVVDGMVTSVQVVEDHFATRDGDITGNCESADPTVHKIYC